MNSRGQGRDERVWSVATWSAPFVIQAVLGVLIAVLWLLGKSSFVQHDASAGEQAMLLIATGVTVVASSTLSGTLLTRKSPVLRGIGIGLAGSAAVVLIGGVGYGLWLF